MKRIDVEIGHIKIADLRPGHLNNFYKKLGESVLLTDNKAHSLVDLNTVLKGKKFMKVKFCELSKISKTALNAAINGENVAYVTAEKISKALGMKTENLFELKNSGKFLSNKTILEYHRLISTILAQAEKEMLVQFNMASKATPPKLDNHEVNYFEPETIEKIRDCLETEPLKWRLFTHLLLITGCRRGEIAGLKWGKIDFDNNQIKIDASLLSSRERGVYEDSTKTSTVRFIKLPAETIDLIKQYKKEYLQLKLMNGSRWMDTDYLFVSDNGMAIHPDSITGWLKKFSKRHELPHINPHAFRHTHASILYFSGVNSITISKRLGHAKVSTTTDIYSHIIKKSDEQASECAANVFLRSRAGRKTVVR
jgi:integrase